MSLSAARGLRLGAEAVGSSDSVLVLWVPRTPRPGAASVGSVSTSLRQADLASVPGDDGNGNELLGPIEQARQLGDR